MKFFNRYILLYSLVVLVAALLYFFGAIRLASGNYKFDPGIWLYFVYLFIIFTSALLIGRKDDNHAYAGFNYHLVTYLITNAVPIAMALCHVLDRSVIGQILYVMLFWGAGLLFHFAMYWFIFRKQTIKSYNKEDVFK